MRFLPKTRLLANGSSSMFLKRVCKGEEFIQDSNQFLDTAEVRRRIGAQANYPGFPEAKDAIELKDFIRSL